MSENNPIICYTWNELVNAARSEAVPTGSKYIKMADVAEEDKVIDFAEIQPNGFTETVYLCNNIDFNNWTFKNFYSTAPIAIIMSNLSEYHTYSTWKNLNMINFYHGFNGSSIYGVKFISANPDSESFNSMSNCNFSGQINYKLNNYTTACPMFIGVRTEQYVMSTTKLKNCGFNVKAKCNSTFSFAVACDMEKCNVNLDVDSYKTVLVSGRNNFVTRTRTKQRVNNCRFSGEISNSDTSQNILVGGDLSSFNVYDIETNAPMQYSGGGISVFNVEKSPDTSATSSFVACTTAQLKDEEILQRSGFPCAERINNNGSS